MIDLISSLFKEGEAIKIEYGNSNKIVSGTILKMLPSSIALKLDTGGIAGIKGDEIISFDSSDCANSELHASEKVSIGAADNDIETRDEVAVGIETSSSKSNTSTSEVSSFKPGDVIPLTELYKIDPKLKKKTTNESIPTDSLEITKNPEPSLSTASVPKKNTTTSNQSKKKPSLVGKGFDALAPLVEEQHEIDNLKTIPAIGVIASVVDDRRFGFIFDSKTRKTYFFSYNDIIGDLKVQKNKGVIYTETKNTQGDKAIYIHKAGTVKDLLEMSSVEEQKGNYQSALHIINHILSAYPDNFSADVAKQHLSKLAKKQKMHTTLASDETTYTIGKGYALKKEYEKAIQYFLQAIKEHSKTESAVKDLIMLYIQLFRSDYLSKSAEWKKLALEAIKKYSHSLPQNITTWNFLLHNCYIPLDLYEETLKIIDTITNEPIIQKDNDKCSVLLYTKAIALIRLKRIDEAEQAIDESLSYNSQNQNALQVKESLSNLDASDNAQIESLLSTTEFNINSGGLSTFIVRTLEDYDEYAGAKTKDIESRNFTLTTLKDVRDVIDKAGSARAKERATYLLTEGKLMQELEPSEEIKLRTVMARYCNAMALHHISENSPMDIIRFYYNESFALEEVWDSNVRQIALYLLTHVHSYTALINDSGKNNSIENTLSLLLPKSNDYRTWDNILTMCLNNGTIFAQLFTKLYNIRTWREKAIAILSHYDIKNVKANISQNEFIDIWNSVRENRLNLQKRLTANIKSLGNCSNIEEATALLGNIRQYREDWISPLDLNRMNNIVNFILPALESFVKSSGYRNKESNYNNANGQIQQFVDEITNGPTKLSYEAMLPLMDKIRVLLKDAFDDIVVMSEPKITLGLLSTETVINDDETVSLQISVANHKESSPIKEVSVEVVEDKDVKFIQPSETQLHYNAIDGGESSIFKLNIKVSDEIIKNKATAINILCKYKSGENLREKTSLVTLKLYSPEDFNPIDNPYAPIADGGPVPLDSTMFYGREEFITNIVDAITQSPSKQIIIYGQKRCGKSSVMLHLKEKLEATGKNFCVFFSLGDIIQNLTEASFYHKILSSIKDELDDLEFDGKAIPKIQFPTTFDFKNEDIDNPLNTFTKYMRLFKRACKVTEGWEDRNLVVMIDEFTYLYTEIKKEHISPSIMKQWKAVTQNDKAQFSVVLVGQDVVPSFKKEDYARNAFGVIQDIRLTYLQEEPARELIEKPILDENGESRYIGNAVSRIIEYTSRNPYYIQIFCARLVDYMNRNKSIKVTEADVNDVARSFVIGEQALEEDKFDNLIRAGETEDLQEYPENEILAILKQIAVSSRNIGYCCIDDINILGDREREQEIIKHLIDREVLEQKGDNNYRIQVKLFQEWLLNH